MLTRNSFLRSLTVTMVTIALFVATGPTNLAVPVAASDGSAAAAPDPYPGCRDPLHIERPYHIIRLFNFGFEDETSERATTEVSKGQLLCFVWTEGTHTVTSGVASHPEPLLGPLNSGAKNAGSVWRTYAENEGRFVYTCQFHPTMNGLLEVVA